MSTRLKNNWRGDDRDRRPWIQHRRPDAGPEVDRAAVVALPRADGKEARIPGRPNNMRIESARSCAVRPDVLVPYDNCEEIS